MRLPLHPAVFAACVIAASPAWAQTSNYRTIEATGGQVTRVAVVTALKRDCTAGEIGGVKVVTAPKNGNLQLKRGKLKTPASFRCPNVETQAEAVFYQPRPSFTGDDEIVYETKSADGSVERYTVRVTIKPGSGTPARPAPGKPDDKKGGTLEL